MSSFSRAFLFQLNMNRPKRPWREPLAEEPLDLPRQRAFNKWSEPAPESRHMIVKNPYKLLEAKPKTKADSTSHYIQPKLHGPLTSPLNTCTFPRFKKSRNQTQSKPMKRHSL